LRLSTVCLSKLWASCFTKIKNSQDKWLGLLLMLWHCWLGNIANKNHARNELSDWTLNHYHPLIYQLKYNDSYNSKHKKFQLAENSQRLLKVGKFNIVSRSQNKASWLVLHDLYTTLSIYCSATANRFPNLFIYANHRHTC